MIGLKLLKIKKYNLDTLSIHWEFKDTDEDLSNYEIDVYKSETPGEEHSIDEYNLVASGQTATQWDWTDTGVSGLNSHNRTWYFKLKIKDTLNNEFSIQPSKGQYFNNISPDKYHKYILKKKIKAIDKRQGRDCFLIKKRTWGTKSQKGWDETLQKPTGEGEYGTGWKDPYYEPIPFKAMITPHATERQLTQFGVFESGNAMISTLPYPPIREGDIIVDNLNERWRVLQMKPVQKRGVTVEQVSRAELIHASDELYDIKVPYEY